MRKIQKFSYIWDKLFVFLVVLGVMLPVSPANVKYVGRDPGVFLYMGWRILDGDLPYRDVWDHKPPTIFYLNAFGLWIAHGSRWGVWGIEFLSLYIAACLGLHILKRVFGTASSIISTYLWVLTLIFVILGGNFTTEYTLPLQFVALWLADQALKSPKVTFWKWFALGLSGGVAFFTKQTAIGIWISIALFLVFSQFSSYPQRTLIILGIFSAGFLTVCLGWAIFFALQGGLWEFWDATFRFNFFYAREVSGLKARVNPILMGIRPLTTTGLFQLAEIGYILAFLFWKYKREHFASWSPLLPVSLIDMPLELLLISLSGRMYAHYYMSLLPVLAVLATLTFWMIFSSWSLQKMPSAASSLLTLGFLLAFSWASFRPYRDTITSFRNMNGYPVGFESVIHKIESETTKNDKVLLWGAETSINYLSGRLSPTRFVYQYPLYTKGYVNEELILEFLDDLIRERPRLIIDTRNPKTPMYNFPVWTEKINRKVDFLQCQYRLSDEVEELRWVIYEYADNCTPER